MPVLRDPPSLRLMAWTAFWVFLLDQATKWLVVHWLGLNRSRPEIDVLPPLLNLRWAENRGVNFGLFADANMRWPLVALAIGISGFVIWWVRKEGGDKRVHISAGLLVGGALGNAVDRLLNEWVADFLNFPFFGDAVAWGFERHQIFWAWLWGEDAMLSADRYVPQFSLNIADIAIALGALGLVLFAGRGNGKEGGKTPVKPEARPETRPEGKPAKAPAKPPEKAAGKTTKPAKKG